MGADYVNKDGFQKEQSDIIKSILTNRYFNPWKEYNRYNKDENYQKSLQNESRLEIYATAICNQKCEYCYLVKYEDLYPREYDKPDIILNNLKVLMDWVVENHFYIPTIEFFTGEVWHTQFGLDMLQIVYDAIIKNELQTDMVLIPSNCSFILDSIQTQKIQHYINAYEKAGVRLCFSISIDGKIIDNYRPLNSKMIKTDRYYEDLFLFASRNNFFFHPMVASCNVAQWIENYKWWEEMCNRFNRPVNGLMMLEVRNAGWTDENIQDYVKFLQFLQTKERDKYNNDEDFLASVFNFNNQNNLCGYVPWALTFADTFPGCTICDSLTVRIGDMAICPCHRTAYNKLLYGHFVLKDNKIVDIEGNNPEIASRILLGNNNLCSPKCDTCPYNPLCLKGCFGSQYETNKDPFFPIEDVCKLMKAKYNFIVQSYISYGAIDYLKSISPYNLHYPQAQQFLKILEELKDVGEN